MAHTTNFFILCEFLELVICSVSLNVSTTNAKLPFYLEWVAFLVLNNINVSQRV